VCNTNDQSQKGQRSADYAKQAAEEILGDYSQICEGDYAHIPEYHVIVDIAETIRKYESAEIKNYREALEFTDKKLRFCADRLHNRGLDKWAGIASEGSIKARAALALGELEGKEKV